MNGQGRKLTIRRSRLIRNIQTDAKVKWQRPHIGIIKHLDNGQFNPPSHLSAFAQTIFAGFEIRWEGRRQTREEVTR